MNNGGIGFDDRRMVSIESSPVTLQVDWPVCSYTNDVQLPLWHVTVVRGLPSRESVPASFVPETLRSLCVDDCQILGIRDVMTANDITRPVSLTRI